MIKWLKRWEYTHQTKSNIFGVTPKLKISIKTMDSTDHELIFSKIGIKKSQCTEISNLWYLITISDSSQRCRKRYCYTLTCIPVLMLNTGDSKTTVEHGLFSGFL